MTAAPPPGPPAPPARTVSVTPAPPRSRQRQILWAVFAVLVAAVVLRMCAGGENTYEKITHELTAAVQSNDMAAVQKLENSETAAEMTRARLGRAADVLAPLGKIKRVKENTPAGDGARVHEFDVTFEKGAIHEKIQFDPQDKVFHFRYDPIPAK